MTATREPMAHAARQALESGFIAELTQLTDRLHAGAESGDWSSLAGSAVTLDDIVTRVNRAVRQQGFTSDKLSLRLEHTRQVCRRVLAQATWEESELEGQEVALNDRRAEILTRIKGLSDVFPRQG